MSTDKDRACNRSFGEKTVLPITVGALIIALIFVFTVGGQWGEIKRVAADESIHLSESEIREAMDETFVTDVEHKGDMRLVHQKLDAIAKAVGARLD